MLILHPCPRCDKPESSFDGASYCGKCEEEYRKELEEFDALTDANFAQWAAEINQ